MRNLNIVILGDSFNNTLGLIRSIGESGEKPILILIGEDRLFVSKSKYLDNVYYINDWDKVLKILINLGKEHDNSFLICSNDHAAKFVDENEPILSKYYNTPLRGKCLNSLFDKNIQCKLAKECGIKVPESIIYNRKDSPFPKQINFPILIKPNNSNNGEKSDIHICRNTEQLLDALNAQSICNEFIIQEYIDKDFEINLIGIASENGVYIPGGIKKIRHYPTKQSPCSFGQFLPIKNLIKDVNPLIDFVKKTKYNGPFSIELIHKGDINYFMEMNFRHDGLAYATTASGVNLLDYYIHSLDRPRGDVKPTFMMDLSIDFCHVKKGHITLLAWLKDFLKTGCQLNFNLKDVRPTFYYYLSKYKKKLFSFNKKS